MINNPSQDSKNPLSVRCRGRVLHLESPVVMGILNTTPDSFSDGGEFIEPESALNRISEMANQGAHIIDIGGESTRPGSEPVSVHTELQRTIPIVEQARRDHPGLLFSIDTTKFEVARKALDAGADIINDVSSLRKEPRFADLCAETGAAYICMHSQGDPKTMQKNPTYSDVVEDVLERLGELKLQLNSRGVDNIIMDPGIGFGKTTEHNLQLIAELPRFKALKCPILMGASRKSLIGSLLGGRPAGERLAGTIALHYHSLMMGASILRVHDVREAVDSVKIFNALKKANVKRQ